MGVHRGVLELGTAHVNRLYAGDSLQETALLSVIILITLGNYLNRK